jgi:hypothetical protein
MVGENLPKKTFWHFAAPFLRCQSGGYPHPSELIMQRLTASNSASSSSNHCRRWPMQFGHCPISFAQLASWESQRIANGIVTKIKEDLDWD